MLTDSVKARLRHSRRAGLAVVVVLSGAAGAVAATPHARAAGPAVHLNLQGGYANHARTACGIRHHYTYYHPARRVPFNGQVLPAPQKPWRVKVKFKKCVRGRFVTVQQTHVSGGSRGDFRGSMRSPGRGFFFARAYYYGVRPAARSDKQYFRVR
jgi:hypothetical protein